MTNIHFAAPQWLWIGALCVAAAAVALARAERLRRRAVTALAGTRFVTTVSRARRLVKTTLILVGLAATFVALARPLLGFRWEEERREGIDLMFAVDTSKSMGTTDLRPDRLTRAKLAVSDLLRQFPGERVGLIAFAGEAFVQAPMTIDHAVFGEALDALDTSIIPRGGTDIASPIRAAVDAMATEPDRRKLLVILSDGEDLQGEALNAAKEAGRAGLVIYTVGVGTRAGDLVPTEHDGQRDVMRDADGRPVHSRLDEQTLLRLAQSTGGAYAPLGPDGRGLETLYREHLAHLSRRTVEERSHKVYTERFGIPLGVALACLLLELLLGERRRRRTGVAIAAAGAALAVMAAMPGVSTAATTTPTPSASALAAPSAVANGVPTYNEGTSAYRKKDFAAARDRFQDATHTTDIAMQADAYYDLGNARYRIGQATGEKDRSATIEAWKSAVAAYDGALALRSQDGDARFNRDLVARRLAALEQEEQRDQQRRKQNQPNQPGQNKQQKESPNNQQQGQGKQGQSPSAQGQKDQGSPKSEPGQPQQGKGAGKDSAGQSSSSSQNGKGQEQGAAPRQHGADPRQAAEPTPEKNAPSPGPGVVSGPSDHAGANDQPAGARRDPGSLSANEAIQLLDSVSGELRRMPVASARRQKPNTDDNAPIKDW